MNFSILILMMKKKKKKTSMTIPPSIKNICEETFSYCILLTEINITSSVTKNFAEKLL